MERKRIGNDIELRCPVYEPDGSPADLENAISIKVEIRGGHVYRRDVTDFKFSGNLIDIQYIAEEQKSTGTYDLWIEYKQVKPSLKGGVRTATVDICGAFELVSKTCELAGINEDPIYLEGIVTGLSYDNLTEENKAEITNRLLESGQFEVDQMIIARAESAAEEAETQALYAKTQGDDAKEAAEETRTATTNAQTATESANQAADEAHDKAFEAVQAAALANNRAGLAEEKAGIAQTAADNANQAASNAAGAAASANNAATAANTAKENADTAATGANEAAANANSKATLANEKALLAEQKAGEADEAKERANQAAENANTIANGLNDRITELELLQPEKYTGSWVVENLSPDSDKQYGDEKVADCWRPYLIDCTKIDGDEVYDDRELMRNNFLRFVDGSFAPTVGITEAMRAECDVELYLDSSHTQKYCDAGMFNATDFYNEHGMGKLYDVNGSEVRVLRPWETTSQNYTIVLAPEKDMWFIDNVQGKSGKKWKGVFNRPTMWDGIEAKELKRTGIAPGASTTVGDKFRNFFFLYNTGDTNTKSSAGSGGVVSIFVKDRQYPRHSITQLNSVTYGRNNNPDTSLPYPFAEMGMFAFCAFISSMEIKHKTKYLHNNSLFGSGISGNDSCSNESQLKSNGGTRCLVEGVWNYTKWGSSNNLYYDSAGNRSAMDAMFNSQAPKEQCMESQMAASFAAELGIQEGVEFDFYGEAYSYKNIPGVNGLVDGEMNVKVLKDMGEDVSAFNASGTPIEARVECVLRMSLVNGFSLCGDVFKYIGGGCEMVGLDTTGISGDSGHPYKIYLETDQKKFHNETAGYKDNFGIFDFESAYPLIGEYVTFGNDYRKSIAPYTIAGGEQGGGLATGECAYMYGTKNWSATLNRRVRIGLRQGGNATNAYCAARLVICPYSVSYAYRNFAGFAQVLMRSKGATP